MKKYVYSSAETTKMLYDAYDCVADYNDADNLLRYYITPGLDENVLVYDVDNTEEYFYLHDGLGTVCQILDDTQNVENQYDYEGFGTSLSSTETIYNRFRYTGRAIDTETESANSTALYYYRARTYDSTIGSFTSRDPLLALNLYSYCAAKPIVYTDPFGCEKLEECTRSGEMQKGIEKWKGGFDLELHKDPGEHCQLKVIVKLFIEDDKKKYGRFSKYKVKATDDVKKTMKEAVTKYWGGWKIECECDEQCPDGIAIVVMIEFVDDLDDSHSKYAILLINIPGVNMDLKTWNMGRKRFEVDVAHEIGHMLGNFDESIDDNPESIMGGESSDPIKAELKPRNKPQKEHFDAIMNAFNKEMTKNKGKCRNGCKLVKGAGGAINRKGRELKFRTDDTPVKPDWMDDDVKTD